MDIDEKQIWPVVYHGVKEMNRMRILVLNGSPKREHSDTLHITRALLEGMNEAAHQDIHIIHAIDKHIKYCTVFSQLILL